MEKKKEKVGKMGVEKKQQTKINAITEREVPFVTSVDLVDGHHLIA